MKLPRTCKRFNILGTLASLALAAGTAHAATIIPIPNGNFELGNPATNWGAGGQTETFDHTGISGFGSPPTGSGPRFAYTFSDRAATQQTIPVAYVADTTYTFQGWSVASNNPDVDIRFILGYDDVGFVELAGQTYDLNPVTSWSLLNGVSFTTGASGGPLGKNIVLRIQAIAPGNQALYFDEVTLTSVAIPEPSAALLGGLGVLVLLRRRR